uniref:Uncharacterized protein n=1 Tax=Setaria italica TaxID=4555 RepID=K4AJK3_SETIT
MSFRRFLYLVAKDCADRSYSLRRIDTSRFFFRGPTEGTPTPLDGGCAGAADPSAVEDGGRLPDPMINLRPLPLGPYPGSMGFVLFKNNVNNGEHDKIVAIDGTGRSLICDSDVPPTVHYLPTLFSPKFRPFSLTVGFSLYHRSTYIDSYAVVAGTSIVVSHNAGGRTYRFDTASKTWRKAGNWVLPFTCLAEYVPEHKLWFGVSSTNDGNRFCAADLVASPDSGEMRPPVVRGLWKELGEPPPEWSLGQTYAVHLGSSRFCIVRFFVVVGGPVHVCPVSYSTFRVEEELQAVITGVDVD